jgi:hypothetical protein
VPATRQVHAHRARHDRQGGGGHLDEALEADIRDVASLQVELVHARVHLPPPPPPPPPAHGRTRIVSVRAAEKATHSREITAGVWRVVEVVGAHAQHVAEVGEALVADVRVVHVELAESGVVGELPERRVVGEPTVGGWRQARNIGVRLELEPVGQYATAVCYGSTARLYAMAVCHCMPAVEPVPLPSCPAARHLKPALPGAPARRHEPVCASVRARTCAG